MPKLNIFHFTFSILILIFNVKLSECSIGDRSDTFYKCVTSCTRENCTDISAFEERQPLHLKVLSWSCLDECRYDCIWPTTDWFVNFGIGVPQFYGKWPFIRILGLQEPASVLFSLLNLATHVKMIKYFRGKVNPEAPFYGLCHIYFFICVNGWIWSAVFHARDTPLTEKLDYLSAFSMVLFSLHHFFTRLTGSAFNVLSIVSAVVCSCFFAYHSYSALLFQMDYGYNMIANIVIGVVDIVGWLVWCWFNRRKQRYVWQCAAFVLLVALTTLLEIADFPPIFWMFDAHALWHFATAPLPILWYRFLADDCSYLWDQKSLLGKVA